MLQKLNERIQGVIAWLIIILIAITFTLFGLDYYIGSHQGADVKVVINDEPVSKQAFEVDYRRSRAQLDSSRMTAEADKNLQKNILDQIITNTVTVQAARQYGFDVKTQQANAVITTIQQFQQDGHFSQEKYQQALSGALFTPESFQNEVKQGMLLNQQRFAFVGSAFALPEEVERFVRLYMQNRSYAYLTIPSAVFKDQVHVKDEAIQSYYRRHQNKFKTPEKISIEYVQLSLNDIKSRIKIDEPEIRQYYDDNKSNFLKPAQWKVAHILLATPNDATESDATSIENKAENVYQELKSDPDKFDAMLKTLSDDKLSIANKGELPWLVAGQTEFDKALAGLSKKGQISKPIRTEQGFEIFKLVDYKPASLKPYEEVKDTIQEQLLTEKAQTKYANTLEKLSDLSYQTPDTLKPVAEELDLSIKETPPFSRKGGDDAITKNKAVISSAYSHDVLELENNSEPVQLNNDSVIVLRKKEHFNASKKEFSTVKDEITERLVQQAALNKAKEFADALIQASEEKQKSLMATYKLNWHVVNESPRENEKVSAEINNFAFSLSKPGHKSGSKLSDGSYVIVDLKAIHDGKLSALDKEQQKSITQQIEASYGMMAYDLYVNSLIAKAKIERH